MNLTNGQYTGGQANNISGSGPAEVAQEGRRAVFFRSRQEGEVMSKFAICLGLALGLTAGTSASAQTLSGTIPILSGDSPQTFGGDFELAGDVKVRVGAFEYLVVGGGGGGARNVASANNAGGGGGGGQVLAGFADRTAASHAVTIGGGAKNSNGSYPGALGGSGVVFVRYAGAVSNVSGSAVSTLVVGGIDHILRSFTVGDALGGISLVQTADFPGILSGEGGLTASGAGAVYGAATVEAGGEGNPFNTFRFATPTRSLTLVDNSPEGFVDIAADTNSNPVWTGALSGEWSTGTLAEPKNWVLDSGGATDFRTLDHVLFDDSATGTTDVVVIGGDVSPGSSTFSNSTLNYTLSGAYGVVAGPVLKSGAGTLAIYTTNAFNSATLEAGTMVVGHSRAISGVATAVLTIAGGELRSGGAVVLSNAVVLAGNFTLGGGLTLAGRIDLGAAGRTVTVNDAGAISGIVSGDVGLVKAGAGALTLSGSNTFTGGTTIRAGTLVHGNGRASGGVTAGGIVLGDAGTGTNDVELRFTAGVQNSSSTTTHKSVAVDSHGSGTAKLTFDQGGAYVDASLSLAKAVTLRTTASGYQYGLVGPITGGGAGAGNESVAFSAPLGATLHYTAGYTGSGIVTNDFAGNVRFTGGGNVVLQNLGYIDSAFVNGTIPDAAGVTVDAGTTWTLRWGVESIDALNGAGSVYFDLADDGRGLTVGAGGGSGVFSGGILGSASLTKTGAGTQTLAGVGFYTGSTTVEAGTLALASSAALPKATALAIYAGARLSLAAGVDQKVRQLTLGGQPMPTGTYGSTASSAEHKDDAYFAGTGILTVAPKAAPFNDFLVGAWWGPAESAAEMKVYRECGFNTVMVGRYTTPSGWYTDPENVQGSMDLAHQNGMGTWIDTYTQYAHPWGGYSWGSGSGHRTASLQEMQWLQWRFGQHPSLIGYLLGDDQSSISGQVANNASYLRSTAPDLFPWVCVNGWVDPGTLASYGIPMADPQIYPTLYNWGISADEHVREYLDTYFLGGYWDWSRSCQTYGVKFWPMFNVAGAVGTSYMPSDSLTRFPAYATIAYGGKGYWYFCYSGGSLQYVGPWSTEADVRAHLTPLYDVSKRVNHRVLAWGPWVVDRYSPGLFGTIPGNPGGLTAPGGGKLVQSASDRLVMGVLTKTNANPLVMVVNGLTSKNLYDLPLRTVTIQFHPQVTGINVIEGGTSFHVEGRVIALTLEPGGGQLLELEGVGLEDLTRNKTIYGPFARWDADAATSGAQDGTGIWSTGATNWWNGTTNTVWSNGNGALIGASDGAAGTIAVSGTVSVATLTLGHAGSGTYTVSGGAMNLSAVDGNAGDVDLIVNGDATISTPITITGISVNYLHGLSIGGAGTLTLAGAVSPYDGRMDMKDSVTLKLAPGGSINLVSSGGNQVLFGNPGTTLVLDGGSFSSSGNNGSAGGAPYNLILNSGAVSMTGGSYVWLGGALALNGGTFSLKALTGAGSVAFNGGTLRALASSGAFMDPAMPVVVRSGGAVFDTAGYNLTVGAALRQDPSLSPLPDGGLVKRGQGTLTLTATNTFGGPTAIGGGSLIVAGAGSLGGGAYAADMTNDGVFVYGSSAAQVLGGDISGTGSLVKAGTGALTLSGANAYSGGTIVSNGALIVEGSMGPGNVAVATSNATFAFAGALAGALSSSGDVKPGTNALGTLAVSNGYTQAASGTLSLGIAGPTNFGVLDVAGAASLGGALEVSLANGFVPASTQSFRLVTAGSIAGSFAMLRVPPLVEGLAWAVSYTNDAVTLSISGTPPPLGVVPSGLVFGTTTTGRPVTASFAIVNTSGSMAVTGTAAVAMGSPPFSVGGGAGFSLAPYASTNVTVSFAPSLVGNFTGAVVFAGDAWGVATGAVSGAGIDQALVWNPSGAAGGSDGSGTWNSNTQNWWGGILTPWYDGHEAVFGSGGAAGTVSLGAAVAVSGITFNAVSGSYVIQNNAIILSAASTITAHTNATINSTLAGGGLVKSGAGTLILGGSSTYGGGTTVSNGTLRIGNNTTAGSISGSSAVNVADGATVEWYRSDTTQQTITNAIRGAGTVSWRGAGTTDLASQYAYSGDATGFSGTWRMDGGRLRIAAAGALGSGAVDIRANGQWMLSMAGTVSNDVTITDSSGWRDGGVRLGAIRLEGENTLSGHITLNQTNHVVLGDGSGLHSTVCGYGAGNHHLTGALSGPGDFAMDRYTSWNGGTPQFVNIWFEGALPNTYTGMTVVDGQGSVASLWLNKAGGAMAIQGGTTVRLGSGTGGQANLRMAQNEQFGTSSGGVVMSFVNGSGQWMRFDLKGTTQTLAGLNAGTSNVQAGAVIQNQGADGEIPLADATLTLNGSGSYLYNGYLRDADNGSGTWKVNLVKDGIGTQALVGTVIDYTGATSVRGGRLVLLNNDDTWTSGFDISAGATVEIYRDSGSVYEHRYNGFRLSGAGTLQKTGTGELSMNEDNNSVVSMSPGGLIDVQGGVLRLGWGYRSTWSNNLSGLNIANGAVFDMWDNTVGVFVDALTGDGTFIKGMAYNGGPGTLTLGVADSSGTFGGVLMNGTGGTPGILSLAKTGAGTQVLTGTNAYTGATSVSNGALLVNGSLANTAVTVAPAGTLGGTGTINGAVIVGGTLSPGASVGTLTVRNNLVLTGSATLAFELGTNSDLVAVAGNLTLDGTLNVTDAGGFATNTYTLFAYTGALTDNGLAIGELPGPAFACALDTNTVGQVNLNVSLSPFGDWLVQNFGGLDNPAAAPGADGDGDGLNNEQEFLSGTQPTNSASVLQNVNVRTDTNGFYVVTWDSVGGKSYRVQYSDGDAGGGYADAFADIPVDLTDTNAAGAFGAMTFTDDLALTAVPPASNRFYRVRIVAP
jgi:autotransporter-associated beta strand protein